MSYIVETKYRCGHSRTAIVKRKPFPFNYRRYRLGLCSNCKSKSLKGVRP
jgi:hypothetical protein